MPSPSEIPSICALPPACVRPNNCHMTGQIPAGAQTLQYVTDLLEQLIPNRLAQPWDNTGLLAGRPEQAVKNVLLAIDLTPAVAREACANAADLLICYHPPLFKPAATFVASGVDPAALAALFMHLGIAIYSPHTALDAVSGGVNDSLAKLLGLRVTGSFDFLAKKEEYVKIVTFVPQEAVEKVADALFAAGAGNIGQETPYSRCSFRSAGTGTFFGNESTHPAVGEAGKMQHVPEVRLETILPRAATSAVVAALLQAHPYEEPAFDLIPLVTAPEATGAGRLAELPHPQTLRAFAQHCARAIDSPISASGDADREIHHVAILAGSCGRTPLEHLTGKLAPDCIITGELKHHDVLAYTAAGIATICLGHVESERPVLPTLCALLRKHLPSLNVRISEAERPAQWHVAGH